MKTINVIASENNVSVQTVYRHVRKLKLENMIIETVKNGVKWFDDKDVILINESIESVKRNIITVERPESDIIKSLRLEIDKLRVKNKELEDELKLEREHNRSQSDKIIEIAENLSRLNENSQILLAQQRLLPEKKKGFLWFGKKNKQEND